MSWKKCKLIEVAEFRNGYAFKSSNLKLKRQEHDMPIFKMGNIKVGGGYKEHGRQSYINLNLTLGLDKHLTKDYDILMSMTDMKGNVRLLGHSAQLINKNKFLVNQRVGHIRPKESVNKRFIYYYINSNEYISKLRMQARTGVQVNLTSESIINSIIRIPPLQTQDRIANILSTYDDLIENNLKRIKLLEQAAQNIYKEWFVNLRFPGYENTPINEETGLPVGWEVKRSDQVFKINIGKTPPRKESEWFSLEKGYKWVSISDMNKSIVFIQKTKERITDLGVTRFNVKVVPKGTVLLSFKLTIGSVVIATEDMVTNEAIAHFNIDNNTFLSTEYTYCYLSSFPYKTLGSTSSIGQALNSKIVKSIPVLLPQQNLVSLFTKIVNPTFMQIENLITQNQKLKAARDILLPRLMNRTIKV